MKNVLIRFLRYLLSKLSGKYIILANISHDKTVEIVLSPTSGNIINVGYWEEIERKDPEFDYLMEIKNNE